MAILTKIEIVDRIKKGDITFTPSLDTFQLKSHAVDLRLGYTFLIPKRWHLTAKGREAINIDHFHKEKKTSFDVLELEQGQYFELLPGEFVSVSTLETIKVPQDVMAILYPRSSTNRRGLSVDLTGIIDSGYEGKLTIPLRNNTTSQVIRLYPGERFCQVVFEELTQTVETPKSRYHKKDIIEGFIAFNSASDEKEIEYLVNGDIRKLKSENPII